MKWLLPPLVLIGCTSIDPEDAGECLQWKSMVVEKKERLPYPMSGTVVREEQVLYCIDRAVKEESA